MRAARRILTSTLVLALGGVAIGVGASGGATAGAATHGAASKAATSKAPTSHSTTSGKSSAAKSSAANSTASKSNTIIGTSLGGGTAAAVHTTYSMFPDSKIARFYETGSAKLFTQSAARYIPASSEIWYSFRNDPKAVASGAFDAQFKTIYASWVSSGRTIKWTWIHEADNPAMHINIALYQKGWARLLAIAKAHPSSRVKSMSIYMAYLLTPRHPHGNPDSWYISGVDVLGFDIYVITNEQRVLDYAKSKHKPYAFAEFGGGKNDVKALAFCKALVAGWAKSPPVGASFFSSNVGGDSTTLNRLPKVLAYLRSF